MEARENKDELKYLRNIREFNIYIDEVGTIARPINEVTGYGYAIIERDKVQELEALLRELIAPNQRIHFTERTTPQKIELIESIIPALRQADMALGGEVNQPNYSHSFFTKIASNLILNQNGVIQEQQMEMIKNSKSNQKKILQLKDLYAEDYRNTPMNHIYGNALRFPCLTLVKKYNISRAKINITFEEFGNHLDYKKRILREFGGQLKSIKESLKRYEQDIPNFPELTVHIDFKKSEVNSILSGLADLAAWISRRIMISNIQNKPDSLAEECHRKLAPFFFDNGVEPKLLAGIRDSTLET